MSETQHARGHTAADGEERQFDLAVATTTWLDAGSKMEACPSDEGVRFSLVRRVTHVTPTAPHLGNLALGLCIHMYTAI
jgi:hypothetical protein